MSINLLINSIYKFLYKKNFNLFQVIIIIHKIASNYDLLMCVIQYF